MAQRVAVSGRGAGGVRPLSPGGQLLRAAEFLALFIVLPTSLFLFPPRPGMILFLLWGGAAAVLAALLLDRGFDRRLLWNARGIRRAALPIFAVFVPGAAALGVMVALFEPDRLFSLVRRAPVVWAFVVVLYPVLSVYPQELIWRTFLFHRYGPLFRRPSSLIAASALAFGYMHVIFHSPVAIVLTIAGGFLFAWTYHRSASTFAASVEHALYGCFVFTIGIGQYFYYAGTMSQ